MSRVSEEDKLKPSADDLARHRKIRQLFPVRLAAAAGRHTFLVLDEQLGDGDAGLRDLCAIARGHYVSSETVEKRLAALGAPKTAALLGEYFPKSKSSRSGDMGEILATEIVESMLGYRVPVRRLRWKDGRDMALRGDDIIGLARDRDAKLQFLKGEAKSRVALARAVVDEAASALDRGRGRPSRHSLLFIADRLREMREDALAVELEEALGRSFEGGTVEHLLFVVTGTDPHALLQAHLVACARKRRRRHVVGLQIKTHAQFVKALYQLM